MVVVASDEERASRSSRLVGRLRSSAVGRAVQRVGFSERHEWLSLLLVWLTLSVAVWSIEQAAWIQPQPSLLVALVVALFAGQVLVRSGWRTPVVYAVMIVLGLAVVVWQTSGLFTALEGKSALASWWDAVSGGRPNEGTVYFAMFLVFITWAIGFTATWFVLRRRSAWLTVTFGGLIVLVNLSNLPKDAHVLLPLYLLTALLLVGQVNLAKQGAWFGRHSARYSYRGMAYLVGAVVSISLVTVLAAWFVPEPPVERIQLSAFAGSADSGDSWYNIFADVHAKWSVIDSGGQAEMSFSDPLSLSSRVQFVVTADQPAYWRTRRYDTYHGWGWTSDGVVEHDSSDLLPAPDSGDAETVVYSVENRLKTDVVLTLGDFVSTSLRVELIAFGSDDEIADVDGPAAEAEEETAATSNGETVTEPAPVAAGDVIAVVTPRLMKPYQRYTATAFVSLPTTEELSQAGDDYPREIIDRYLQLPVVLPWRVKLLASSLTRDSETTYDKVLAIKGHVLELNYNIQAAPTPEDSDAVDYFLFDSLEGVCTEFASALAVMLRAVGIPARLTTGYLEGDFDEKTGSYLLRIRDYHARTEVYFPGYGWIEFSATPVGENIGAVIGATIETSAEIHDPVFSAVEEDLRNLDSGFFGQLDTTTARESLPGPQLYVYFVVIGIPVALVLVVRSGYALWLRVLKRVDDPAEVYQRMCRLASWGKAGPMVQETPLEYCARLALALPLQTASIDTIAEAYIETRFSTRRELGRLQKSRLQKAWVRLVPDLVKGLPRLWRESA